MLGWLIALGAVLLAALPAIPLRLEFAYEHRDAADVVRIVLCSLGLRFRREFRFHKAEKAAGGAQGESARDHLESLARAGRRIAGELPAMRRHLRAFSVREWTWDTTIGADFAPDTAVLCGLAWGVKAMIAGLVSRALVLAEPPRLAVRPSFERSVFQSDVRCIVVSRLGKAICAGWRIVRLARRARDRSSEDGQGGSQHGSSD